MAKLMKVSLRGGFSDRNGIARENTSVQIDSLDERSRVAIANAVNKAYSIVFKDGDSKNRCTDFWNSILVNVYVQRIDYADDLAQSHGYYAPNMFEMINGTIFNDEYHAVLTLVEFIVDCLVKVNGALKDEIEEYFNGVFEKEYVGYRFVGGKIVPVTNPIEMDSIKEACNSPYENVNQHMIDAIRLFADRNKRDYKNVIKESISAVEAMCCCILGKKSTDIVNQY